MDSFVIDEVMAISECFRAAFIGAPVFLDLIVTSLVRAQVPSGLEDFSAHAAYEFALRFFLLAKIQVFNFFIRFL